MLPQWPWDSPGPLGSFPDSIRGSQGNPTLRYTRVHLRADALVASALQESAGGAKQQQQQPHHCSSQHCIGLSQHSPSCSGAHSNEAAVVEIRTHDTMIALVEGEECLNGSGHWGCSINCIASTILCKCCVFCTSHVCLLLRPFPANAVFCSNQISLLLQLIRVNSVFYSNHFSVFKPVLFLVNISLLIYI